MLAGAFRHVKDARERFLDAVQLAASDCVKDAEIVLGIYQGLTETEQATVPIDDLVAAAGVSPSEMLAIVVKAATEHSLQLGDWTAAAMHHRIVEQTAKSALRIGGAFADIAQKDRLVMLQRQKFAPVPRGTTVTVHANASATAKAAAASQPSVPSFLEDVGSLQGPKDAVQRALIGAGHDE